MHIGCTVENVWHEDGHRHLNIHKLGIPGVPGPPSWEALAGLQGGEPGFPGSWGPDHFPSALFSPVESLNERALDYTQRRERSQRSLF